MTDIQIMGLPKNVRKPKIINLLRSVIFGKKLKSKFWIRDAYMEPNSKFQQLIVNFPTEDEAYRAQDLVNGFIYFNGKKDFVLSACIMNNQQQVIAYNDTLNTNINKRYERDRRYESIYENNLRRDRSRSPHLKQECNKIDMEIELVRKQRILVEEERKLLLEKKKLQLLKDFGHNAVKQLETYAAAIEVHSLEDIDPSKTKLIPKKKKPRQNNIEGLPLFVLPCRLIIKQMNEVICKYKNEQNASDISKVLRLSLRRRLAELLKDKEQLSTAKIMVLYRKEHPSTTDEDLMKEIMAEINDDVILVTTQNTKDEIDILEEKKETNTLPDTLISTRNENEEAKQKFDDKPIEHGDNANGAEKNPQAETKEETDIITIDVDGDFKKDLPLDGAEIKISEDNIEGDLDDWNDDEIGSQEE